MGGQAGGRLRRLLLRGQRVAALLPGCRTICHACCDCLLVDRGFIEERATDRRACPPLLIVAAHNELRGTVPPTWVDMTSLKVLDVSGNCGICGNLPFSSNVAVRVLINKGWARAAPCWLGFLNTRGFLWPVLSNERGPLLFSGSSEIPAAFTCA